MKEPSRRALLQLGAVGSALLVAGRAGRARADGGHNPALVTEARAGLKSVIAKFTQVRTVGLLAAEVKSHGTMTIVTPDRLRWELAPPDAVTYWIGPEGIAYRTDKGVVKAGKDAAGKLGAVLSDLLVFVGGDLMKLAPRYLLRAPTREKDGSLHVVATPKADDAKKLVREVRFVTTPDLWAVRTIELEEAGGDRSVITFEAPKRDPKVDPATMRPPS